MGRLWRHGMQRKGQNMAVRGACCGRVFCGLVDKGHKVPSTETYGRMVTPAHTFLKILATAAVSSAAAALEVTMSAFRAVALRELGVALVRGTRSFVRSVYATAGATAATPGAVVPWVDVE
jgi:hypothetical protein